MKKIGILGRNGFIGSRLVDRLKEKHGIYNYPDKDLDILFLFNSPSSNVLFEKDIDYCFEETINGFIHAIQFCRDNHIKLVYPSSGTVYTKNTPYARCKSILEEIHQSYGGDVLGFRIFTGYGEGEREKGEYASVIYKFCQSMMEGRRPVVYGDGSQTRDFIYIDDIVDRIMDNLDKTGIHDIGSGINYSFNQVIGLINKELKTDITPDYIDKPPHYVEETICKNYYPCKVSLEEGIKRVCMSL